MKVGTKSVLFGAHQFLLHPPLVFIGWWVLYGFPWDPRLWVCFVLHDLGYWGKPNMDGPEGERHVIWAAAVIGRWFGRTWGDECMYHSRFWSQLHRRHPSNLCYADKLAIVYMPWWIFLPLAMLTGEIHEYRALARNGKYQDMHPDRATAREWYQEVQQYLSEWVRHRSYREGNHAKT